MAELSQKKRRPRLNGWQRLWVLLAVVYFCGVALVAWPGLPQKLTINEYLGDGGVEGGDLEPSETQWYVQLAGKWVRVQAVAHNPETKEYVYALNDKWSNPVPSLHYRRVPREHSEKEKELLRTKRARYIGLALAWWIVPLLMLYAVGLAIAWIRAGFRRETQTQ